MRMFKDETEARFQPRWEEHRKSIPEAEQYRHIASFRCVVAKELYDEAPADVKKLVDTERMKGRRSAAATTTDEEDGEEGEGGAPEMDAEAKEAKAAAQAEKKVKDDLQRATDCQV